MTILLDNACKYSADGSKILVALHRVDDKPRLSVTNFGEVIPPQMLSAIFERFVRVDKSRSREKGGYGLGLAIADSIARLHSARIFASSSAEHGTTFSVVFPKTNA